MELAIDTIYMLKIDDRDDHGIISDWEVTIMVHMNMTDCLSVELMCLLPETATAG